MTQPLVPPPPAVERHVCPDLPVLDLDAEAGPAPRPHRQQILCHDGIGSLMGVSMPRLGPVHVRVRTTAHGDLWLPLSADVRPDRFDGCMGGPVHFQLDLALDEHGACRAVHAVRVFALIDGRLALDLTRLLERLAHLSRLGYDWDGSGSLPMGSDAIAAMRTFLQWRPLLGGLYELSATLEGGILLECGLEGCDLSIAFSAEGAPELFLKNVSGDREDVMPPILFHALGPEFLAAFDEQVSRHGPTLDTIA